MKKLLAKAERMNGGWIIWAREAGSREWVALGTAGSLDVVRNTCRMLQE